MGFLCRCIGSFEHNVLVKENWLYLLWIKADLKMYFLVNGSRGEGVSQLTYSLWTRGARHPKGLREFAVWPHHVLPAEGCNCCHVEVSVLDSSRKRWWCCAGVGGLIGHLGGGLKARPGPLALMEKHICLKKKKSVSFLSCTDARVAVLHWLRSQCECGWAEGSAPAGGLLSSTPDQCPVS